MAMTNEHDDEASSLVMMSDPSSLRRPGVRSPLPRSPPLPVCLRPRAKMLGMPTPFIVCTVMWVVHGFILDTVVIGILPFVSESASDAGASLRVAQPTCDGWRLELVLTEHASVWLRVLQSARTSSSGP